MRRRGMNRLLLVGVALLLAGFGGYILGVAIAYPGRSFSVTAIMVGIALIAMNRTGFDHKEAQ